MELKIVKGKAVNQFYFQFRSIRPWPIQLSFLPSKINQHLSFQIWRNMCRLEESEGNECEALIGHLRN